MFDNSIGAGRVLPDTRNGGVAPAMRDMREVSALGTTCPVCGRGLASRACKLICECGYFAGCSDYV